MRSDQQTFRPLGQMPRLYVHVAEQILAGIDRGELKPGDRLPSDRELAATIGVSRPTVREALLALEFIGAISVRAGDGAYVLPSGVGTSVFGEDSPLSGDRSMPPQIVIEARLVLEPAVAGLCASRALADELRDLERLLERMEREAQDQERINEFVRLGLGFHSELAQYCGNRFLWLFCSSLVDISQHPLWALVNRQAMAEREARIGQVIEHRSVLEAIGRRDEEAASEAMELHLSGLRASVQD